MSCLMRFKIRRYFYTTFRNLVQLLGFDGLQPLILYVGSTASLIDLCARERKRLNSWLPNGNS